MRQPHGCTMRGQHHVEFGTQYLDAKPDRAAAKVVHDIVQILGKAVRRQGAGAQAWGDGKLIGRYPEPPDRM